MYYTYIARCSDNSLYTGITNDLLERERKHNAGAASKYTRSRLPIHIIYSETFSNRSAAARREYEIKHFSKQQKEQLILSSFKTS